MACNARIEADAAQRGDLTDEMLLKAIARRDRAAFEQFIHRHFQRLLSFALRITEKRAAADAVVSGTFLTVWRSAGTFRGRSHPSTWIFGIAYHLSLKAQDEILAGVPPRDEPFAHPGALMTSDARISAGKRRSAIPWASHHQHEGD